MIGAILGVVLGASHFLLECDALPAFPLGDPLGQSIAMVAAIPLTKGEKAKKNGVAHAAARVAVQLAREDAGLYLTPREIADKAMSLVLAASGARKALDRGSNPREHYDAARVITSEFGAELVERGDLAGMVVGVRFSSGRFTSGAENIFYVM